MKGYEKACSGNQNSWSKNIEDTDDTYMMKKFADRLLAVYFMGDLRIRKLTCSGQHT
jgi:hypothetical protein